MAIQPHKMCLSLITHLLQQAPSPAPKDHRGPPNWNFWLRWGTANACTYNCLLHGQAASLIASLLFPPQALINTAHARSQMPDQTLLDLVSNTTTVRWESDKTQLHSLKKAATGLLQWGAHTGTRLLWQGLHQGQVTQYSFLPPQYFKNIFFSFWNSNVII